MYVKESLIQYFCTSHMRPGNKVISDEKQGSALMVDTNQTGKKKLFLESYGCQMNFADSEIVASILKDSGFGATRNYEEADLILLNTCSIREKAEQTVRKRLSDLRKVKQHNPGALIGVLGCMAERLKSKFLEEEKLVDIVVGPDAYRTLPALISEAGPGRKQSMFYLAAMKRIQISPLFVWTVMV